MQGQKRHSLSYMHLFLPYLLKNSQMIRSTIHFSKPFLCVTLIGSDWSDWSHFNFIMPVMPDKAVFVSGETAVFTVPKAAPSGKERICIFIQTNCEKTNKWAGNMLMLKRLGIHFKNDSYQGFRVDSLHGALSDFKLCRMLSFSKSCVKHSMKGNSQKSIIGAL